MARSISAGLLTEQSASSNTPYINLVFTSADGGTTHDYSSDQKGRRILLIDHNEEAYGGTLSEREAVILLRDDDDSVPNLKGYWVEVGYGYLVSGSPEYEKTSRLWVKHQQEVTAQGRRVVVLELEGVWAVLSEILVLLGNPPYYDPDTYTTDTVYDLIEMIIETEMGWVLAALAEDDSIMGTFQPQFDVNAQPQESAGGIIYRLISMTKSYLRAKKTLEFEVKYPQTSDSVEITYYSNQAPYFYEYMERRNVLIPNHVIVYGNAGADGLWLDRKTGIAKDQDEIDAYMEIKAIVHAASLTTNNDVGNRADSILARAAMESLAGRMYAPHDCQVELYDKIEVQDFRGT